MQADINCPCCSNKSYKNCCARFIEANQLPQTPEELMRSRYTAYTQANIDYIQSTMKSPAADGFDVKEAKHWAQNVTWKKLEVLSSNFKDKKGFVEFIAYFSAQNKLHKIHEKSEFHYINGKWFYVDGEIQN